MQKIAQRPVRSTPQGYFALATVALFSFFMNSARAGRPMVVDDAGIVGAKNCQLESWVYNSSNGTEYWAVPACNLSGNLEIALGGAHIDGTGQRGNIAFLQGKTLFRPLESNSWGAGLVFGTQTALGKSGLGDLFATVPVSFSFHNNRIVAHTNAGLVRVKSSGRALGTWGAGVLSRCSAAPVFFRAEMSPDYTGRTRPANAENWSANDIASAPPIAN